MFFTLFIVFTSFYFLSKIKLEEDISKASTSSNDKINYLLKHSKITDKFIITISLTDSNRVSSEQLIDYASEFVDSLKSKKYSNYISSITYKINDTLISNVMEVFYDNLPIYLSDNDYIKIDSLISIDAVKSSLSKNYKTLLSPTSFALKKFITRDPVGISSIAYEKLKQLQVDENYEIENGYIFTKDRKHLDKALKAFRWFLGENYLGLMVYDEVTGGCHDGLEQYGLNLNQGAESTICYVMARLAFEDSEIKNNLI